MRFTERTAARNEARNEAPRRSQGAGNQSMADRTAWDRQTARVIHYFDSTAGEYKQFWMGPDDLAMHFGYYDASVKSHNASLLKMNEVLAGYAGVAAQHHVLDAGCGYGGSAIWLAQHVGCSVLGITLVPAQVQEARLHAIRRQVADKVHFEQMDFTDTSLPDGSFDVVWAVESIVHTARKREFLQEASRLLKRGGCVLIAEYVLREDPPLSEAERASLSPWLDGWAMPHLCTRSEYADLLEDCGFSASEAYNLTEHVKPSVSRLGKLRLPTLPTAQIVAIVGRGLCALKLVSQVRVHNIEAGVCQSKALRLGQWSYLVLVARKA